MRGQGSKPLRKSEGKRGGILNESSKTTGTSEQSIRRFDRLARGVVQSFHSCNYRAKVGVRLNSRNIPWSGTVAIRKKIGYHWSKTYPESSSSYWSIKRMRGRSLDHTTEKTLSRGQWCRSAQKRRGAKKKERQAKPD